ncbi:MAG: hypothetical protein ACJA0H_000944 [Francisellaceae bacterium]|jgi:hypothetical protein
MLIVKKVNNWTTLDVLSRWHKLFKGTLLTSQYQREQLLTTFEMTMVEETAQVYKQRLIDISWFMRALYEPIARQANKEDKCTGHFWEGRLKSKALPEEGALLACMANVDLNPVRAGIAITPEQ